MVERDKHANVVTKLKTRHKESKSRLEESDLWVAKEKEANKELEEELIMYKKKVWE